MCLMSLSECLCFVTGENAGRRWPWPGDRRGRGGGAELMLQLLSCHNGLTL